MFALLKNKLKKYRIRKKYELTDNTLKINDGIVLHQIKALRTFVTIDGKVIEKGELGGFVEKESNLSHRGCCWIGMGDDTDFSYVCENARIEDNAYISWNVHVYGNAVMKGNAIAYGDMYTLEIHDNAVIRDNAHVEFGSDIGGNTVIGGDTQILNNIIQRKGR